MVRSHACRFELQKALMSCLPRTDMVSLGCELTEVRRSILLLTKLEYVYLRVSSCRILALRARRGVPYVP